jgi:histone-lysine N-methyltransferase SETMAR
MSVRLEKEHLRAIIYDYFLEEKFEKKPKKIHEAITAKYGEDVVHVTTIQRWCNDFRFGRDSLEDAPRCGRPCEAVVDKTIEKCRKLIEEDRRISVGTLSTILNVSKGSVQTIISDHLQAKKVNSKWIPKKLSEDQKRERVSCAKLALRLYRQNKVGFLSRIITQDETKFSLWDPPTNQESKSWVFPQEQGHTQPRTSKTRAVSMLSVWWDESGPIDLEFMPNGVTMNGEAYKNSITSLRSVLPQKRRGKISKHPLLLVDNAPPHRYHGAQAAAFTAGFQFITHPPYSPDLAPSDFFLFPALKKFTRGKVWSGVDDLEQAIIEWLEQQPKEWYRKGIEMCLDRWKKVIQANGEYFE